MTDLTPLVRLVDDDEIFLMSQKLLLQTCGFETVSYASAEAFLEHDLMTRPGCLIADVRMPGLTGLDLQKVLQTRRFSLPMIFLTGHGDVTTAVRTLTHGAVDFIEKPFDHAALRQLVEKMLGEARRRRSLNEREAAGRQKLAKLTPRERQVLERIVAGRLNKQIADDLGISIKTVEAHRASIMDKTASGTVADLMRVVMDSGERL